jgi:ornithine cyclodeaminase/alanine dehydrogenase-like protein (mu-crystallin family)
VTAAAVFTGAAVREAVAPLEAYEAVREAFVLYARGEWTMQPKVYIANYPAGDFRAMPALGGGHALLKWVTSFPGNPVRGLPTVSGLVILSDAEDGRLLCVLDAAAVTALRTAAAAALATETLGHDGPVAVVGCGVNGIETVRMLRALGREVVVYDADAARTAVAEEEHGAQAVEAADALAVPSVITVTPGREVLFRAGSLRAGQHVSLMGADGAGKAEIAVEELARARDGGNPAVRVFVDDWEQASHGGEIARAVEAGLLGRADVADLGAVLDGTAPGRRHAEDVTLFDSTGLAIQDLAIARAAFARAGELDLQTLTL